ncbi:hypothetical protein [Salinarimonas ramus]|uniref:Stress response protein n=1 Tax=Salinarimonas ramus TaxID=690164 RepID=A0A917Q4Q0_9HYPH|nr:hypothetical protein [Salinarimonas ramus]GGK23691.1 hypothetical protein GCM10011322_07940 [Salinarimonas ramus]
MGDLDQVLEKSHRARLFPVLAETSKEGRATSIYLACLASVNEFGRVMLASLGQRVGSRAQIAAYTEVAFPMGKGEKAARPDGLVVLRVGARRWTALVEAKVGNADLSVAQVELYCEVARRYGIDAVVTLSNEFASLPAHHPLEISAAARKKVEVYHWSWMNVLTQATLLIDGAGVEDADQAFILAELVRFLTHPSTGVKGFDRMPAPWPDLVAKAQAGAPMSPASEAVREVVGAWHQEVRDLCLILSRQLTTEVDPHLPRAQRADAEARLRADAERLCAEHCLGASLRVPDAAAPIEIRADLRARAIVVSMKVRAPEDRKSNKARLGWLLRQVEASDPAGIHVRLHYIGRAPSRQASLAEARTDAEELAGGRDAPELVSMEILLVSDLAAKFAQRNKFISELEAAVPSFYERVGQHLKGWQPRPPRLREDRTEPESVSVEALAEESEEEASATQNVWFVPEPE